MYLQQFNFRLPASNAVLAITVCPPTSYCCGSLPYQLCEMTGLLAEAGIVEVVICLLVAPRINSFGDVCVAFGEVLAVRSALPINQYICRLSRYSKYSDCISSHCYTYRVLELAIIDVVACVVSK